MRGRPRQDIAEENTAVVDVDGFAPGSFVLVHRLRLRFKDQHAALADLKHQYPGASFGRTRPSLRYWTWEMRPAPGNQVPTKEVPKASQIRRLEPLSPRNATSAWCSKCANVVPASGGIPLDHKSPGSALQCRGMKAKTPPVDR